MESLPGLKGELELLNMWQWILRDWMGFGVENSHLGYSKSHLGLNLTEFATV
jgi:hypothetical protein